LDNLLGSWFIGYSLERLFFGHNSSNGDIGKLARKVITGGAGNWGDHGMSAHPQLSLEDAKTMVDFILNYGKPAKPKDALPPTGVVSLNKGGKSKEGMYILTASYQDKGAKGIGPLLVQKQLVLRNPRLEGENFEDRKGGNKRMTSAGDSVPSRFQYKGEKEWIAYKDIDLKNIKGMLFRYSSEVDHSVIEVRLDSAKGTLIGEQKLRNTTSWQRHTTDQIKVTEVNGKHKLFFVLRLDADPTNTAKKMLGAIDWIQVLK
jgi:cytochrome c